MKYIRTPDGRILEWEKLNELTKLSIDTCQEEIKEADTIEELCDVFIFKDTCANEWHIVNQDDGISVLGASLFSDTLRGYIETEKGLIPVARYEKGEFELL